MKKLFALLILMSLFRVSEAAIVSSNLLTLVTVNNSTNTGAPIILGAIGLPSTTYAIQSVGTGGTNFSSGGNILVGFGTNTATMAMVGTYNITGDGIASFTLTNNGVLNVYCAFQAFNTTNQPVQIGAQAIQQK